MVTSDEESWSDQFPDEFPMNPWKEWGSVDPEKARMEEQTNRHERAKWLKEQQARKEPDDGNL